MTHKQAAYVLLRITVGVIFLFYGIDKFLGGRSEVAASIAKEFSKTFLPQGLVTLFANALPFFETILGSCVLLGLFTSVALGLATALMIALTFGEVICLRTSVVAYNSIYSIILFLLLFFAEYNTLCLDRLWRKESAAP